MRDNVTNVTATLYFCESSFLITVLFYFYNTFDQPLVYGILSFSDFKIVSIHLSSNTVSQWLPVKLQHGLPSLLEVCLARLFGSHFLNRKV